MILHYYYNPIKTNGTYKDNQSIIYHIHEQTKNYYNPPASHKITYGNAYVTGDIVYVFPSSAKNSNKYDFISIIFAVACHEILGFEFIIINGKKVKINSNGTPIPGTTIFFSRNMANSLINVRFHTGKAGQVVDRLLGKISAEWTEQCTLSGIAYTHIMLQQSPLIFPKNAIPHFGAAIGGKLIKNLQTNEIKYSNNPALCIYDYLVSEIKINPQNIDLASFQTAMETCDKLVTFPWDPSKSHKQYVLNGVIDTSMSPMQVITNMLVTMSGSLSFVYGKWYLYAGMPVVPEYSLSDDDLANHAQVIQQQIHHTKLNTIEVTFLDRAQNYNANIINVTSQQLLNSDSRKYKGELHLLFTTEKQYAIHLANIAIHKSRKKNLIYFPGKLNALKIPINSGIEVTLIKYNWHNKLYKLIKSIFNPQTKIVDMTLEEVDNSIWNLA